MDKLAEIKRLYYETTARSVRRDLARAMELLKSMASEEERERAAVYMDGLSQMRSEWERGGSGASRTPRRPRPARRTK